MKNGLILTCSSVKETESALYYLQSRYYDPELGRFINADAFASTGQGLLGCNMFAYCHNAPVLFEDQLGHSLRVTTEHLSDCHGGVSRFGISVSGAAAEGIVNGVAAFAISGDWFEGLKGAVFGFFQGVAGQLAKPLDYAIRIFDSAKVMFDSWSNGMNMSDGFYLGIFNYAMSGSLGETGDVVTDFLVTVSFSSGQSLIAEGVVNAFHQSSQKNLVYIDWNGRNYPLRGSDNRIFGKAMDTTSIIR